MRPPAVRYDTAITDLRGKISKYRDQSLDVKTNDQYKALLHGIQFSETEIAANEDKILEMMVNADTRDKEVKAAQAELKAETAEIEKEKEEARQRTAEDEKLLAEWRAKRDQIRTGVTRRPAPPLRARVEISRQHASQKFAITVHGLPGHVAACRPATRFAPAGRPLFATPASPFFISIPPRGDVF